MTTRPDPNSEPMTEIHGPTEMVVEFDYALRTVRFMLYMDSPDGNTTWVAEPIRFKKVVCGTWEPPLLLVTQREGKDILKALRKVVEDTEAITSDHTP